MRASAPSCLVMLTLLGCGGAVGGVERPVAGGEEAPAAAAAPAEITPEVGVRIVEARFGAEHSKRAEKVQVPFGVNQNGNELIYVMLERATRHGAAFVGDLAVIMTFRWRGDVVECRTPVMFDGDPRLAREPTAAATAPATGYTTEIDVFKPQPVEAEVTDRELVCRPRPVAVMKRRRTVSTGRSAERARGYDGDTTIVETVQELEKRNVCTFETITRRTTRYDYELKLGFVPPDWAHFAETYADGKIVAGRPSCYKLAEGELGKQPEYRLTAMAYYTGAVKPALPVRMPSRGMVEAQFLPNGVTSEATCNKLLHAASQKKASGGMEGTEGHCTPQERLNNQRSRLNWVIDEETVVDE